MRRLVLVILVVAGLAGCGGSTAINRSSPTTIGATTSSTTVPARRLYSVQTTVLQDEHHGPQVCLGGVLQSLPPQCGGPDLVGLDWTTIPWRRTAGRTTWVDAVYLVGTFDGHRFTLTQTPGRPKLSSHPLDVRFPQICEHPTGTASITEPEFLGVSGLDRFPGVISLWVTDPDPLPPGPHYVVNIYVRPGYAASVTAAVRKQYGAQLCVVEKNAPTLAQLRAVKAQVDARLKHTPLGVIYGTLIDTQRSVVSVEVAVAGDAQVRFARAKFGSLVELHGDLTPVR